MLRRWREQVRIFLDPRQVVLLRVSRGLKPRVINRASLPCAGFPGASSWEAPVAALKLAVRDAQWQGASAQVVLSNHFVRYVLVPWSAQLSDRHERQAYLRHCFGVAYGEAAKRWDLRMSDAGMDKPSLASGIDMALLESLRDTLDDEGIRLDAVHPYLMMSANLTRRWLPRGAVWFALIERGRLCLSLLDNGIWKAVRNYPAEADGDETLGSLLEILLERESMLCGDVRQDWPVVLYSPESTATPRLPGRKVTRVPVQALDGFMHEDNSDYRMAMRAWA